MKLPNASYNKTPHSETTMDGDPAQVYKTQKHSNNFEEKYNKSPKMQSQSVNNRAFSSSHKQNYDSVQGDQSSSMRQTLSKLNKKQWLFGGKFNESLKEKAKTWSDADNESVDEDAPCRIKTLDLFRYALFREKLAFGLGVMFMWYAASWQPISVFILAIMASLMGQYSKQTSLMVQLNKSIEESTSGNVSGDLNVLLPFEPASPSLPLLSEGEIEFNNTTTEGFGPELVFATLLGHGTTTTANTGEPAPTMGRLGRASYDSYGFLAPLYSVVTPLFDSLTAGSSSSKNLDSEEADDIKADFHDMLNHESKQFLRKSFEINGSAFALALTQLAAFFVGMTLITWVAKKQASRVKILYFNSCLQQEVTWFEAIDSASGSGSSLNALVDKFEDGIGTKLALLCYFLGHVGLFTITAFSQMFNLAAFCMPFVLLVGLIIIYLSDFQAVAIGKHSLFAKRSLQLAEEIIAAIRTVFAFNGQQKEITRFSISLQPVYRKSLIKHLYTAFNTSLSKFSIFACFSAYCFYAMHLFPPYTKETLNKATVLAVMRGAEVSIVNILISIPFMEALQQSKGSIARIYAAIERRSKIDPSSNKGAKPTKWEPSISFKMVQFGYADRAGLTQRHRSTLPFIKLPSLLKVNSHPETLPSDATILDQRSYSGSDGNENPLYTNSAGATNSAAYSSSEHDQQGGYSTSFRSARENATSYTNNAHKDKHNNILSRFNLNIRAGQSVALVGPSGSGKSTVLALIQRLYDINSGQLFIGQHNIKDLSVAWLRNQIGVVTQEPRLFDMTIEENIRLGLPDDDHYQQQQQQHVSTNNTGRGRMIDGELDSTERETRIRQQVLEAAQAAGVHEFVTRLPQGYETRVGSGGVQLSGGQKQRIAIARALIRKPKILLLDESTSALDTESEAHVQEALKQASVGRTTLTVAHRLATIKHADLIVVMNHGQVVECGTHDELMLAGSDGGGGQTGMYRQMYEEQLNAVENKPQATKVCIEKDLIFGYDKKSPLDVEFVKPSTASNSTDDCSQLEEVDLSNYEKTISSEPQEFKSTRQIRQTNTLETQDTYVRPSTWELWRFLELPNWSSICSVLVCLVAGLILPMNLIAHSYLFSAFAYQEPEQIGNYLRIFGLSILSFSSLVFIVSFLQVILPGYVGERISTRLRIKTLDSIMRKPVFYFDIDTNSAGSLCDRFNSCISNIQNIAGTRVATMLEALSTLSVGAFYGFGQNLRLSLFCLGFALLVLITTIIESRIVQKESSLQQKFDAQLAHLMVDALSNIKTIASLNKEKFFIDKFSKLVGLREVGIGRHNVCLRIFLMSLKFVMPAMSWSASMYYGCHLLVDGRIDLQTVFIVCPVVLFAVNDTFRALVFLPELLKARKSIEQLYQMNCEFSPKSLTQLQLPKSFNSSNKHNTYSVPKRDTFSVDLLSSAGFTSMKTTGQLSDNANKSGDHSLKSVEFVESATAKQVLQMSNPSFINTKLTNNYTNTGDFLSHLAGTENLNLLTPTTRARGSIQFKNVHFAYPQRPEASVLQGFSLRVAPGETLALVGSSGSGKSTCASILEKFYDFQQGSVELDNFDLRTLDDCWLRSQIGFVMQEPTLLSYTIADNIRYGDNNRFVPMEEVVRVAREANIHQFIMSLPDQYDTQLSGPSHSSGCQLSGGQRQRIAIARALISNAPILIFDEATSALDSRNESLVQDALDKARRGRTSIIIAHRLASIREADKIAVLREGRLVELGKHEDLLKLESGHYKALWLRQEGSSCSGSSYRNGSVYKVEESTTTTLLNNTSSSRSRSDSISSS